MLEKAICSKIVEILEEEIRIYKEVLEQANEKRQALVEGKAAALDLIVRSEQKLSTDIVRLEKERDGIIQAAISSGAIGPEDIIVSKLSKKMDVESGNRVIELATELAEVLRQLKVINDINGDLIKQSLEYIEYTVNIMSSTGMATNLTYGNSPSNPKKPGDKKTFFDTKG